MIILHSTVQCPMRVQFPGHSFLPLVLFPANPKYLSFSPISIYILQNFEFSDEISCFWRFPAKFCLSHYGELGKIRRYGENFVKSLDWWCKLGESRFTGNPTPQLTKRRFIRGPKVPRSQQPGGFRGELIKIMICIILYRVVCPNFGHPSSFTKYKFLQMKIIYATIINGLSVLKIVSAFEWWSIIFIACLHLPSK